MKTSWSEHAAVVVDYPEEMSLLVDDQYGVYFVLVHHPLDFRHLRLWCHAFGLACHDVTHRPVEEFRLPSLHGTADVAIGDDAFHASVEQCHAKSQLSLAHEDDGLAQVHVGGDDG